MRFRMTIMPRQEASVPGMGGISSGSSLSSEGGLAGGKGLRMPSGATTGILAGGKTANTGGLGGMMGNIPGLGSLTGGQQGIILSPDEIVSVDVSISDYAISQTSNSEANVTVRLSGKLLSHVEENEGGLPLSMNSMLSGFAAAGVSELTSGLSKGIQILGSTFAGGLTNTLSGMMGKFGGSTLGLGNLYQKNIENTKELAKWALSYGESTDYRDIVLEMVITEGVSKTYVLPDMYVTDYNENSSIGSGNGNFFIILKQKRYSERKIEIE